MRMRCVHGLAALGWLAMLGACTAVQQGPDRLFPLGDEVAGIRQVMPDLVAQYYGATDDRRVLLRNEIITQRMYAADVNFTAYEAQLTRERQEIGFATLAGAQALNTAGALVTPAQTTRILSGAAAVLTGVKSHYESEYLLSKTIQLLQAQMRANRAKVAARLLLGMRRTAAEYPLGLAMSDLEDYYRAGTLTSGLIEATRAVAEDGQAAESQKEAVVQISYGPDPSTTALRAYFAPGGVFDRAKFDALQAILRNDLGVRTPLGPLLSDAKGGTLRLQLLQAARRKGLSI